MSRSLFHLEVLETHPTYAPKNISHKKQTLTQTRKESDLSLSFLPAIPLTCRNTPHNQHPSRLEPTLHGGSYCAQRAKASASSASREPPPPRYRSARESPRVRSTNILAANQASVFFRISVEYWEMFPMKLSIPRVGRMWLVLLEEPL